MKFKEREFYAIRHPRLECVWGIFRYTHKPTKLDNGEGYITLYNPKKRDLMVFGLDGTYLRYDDKPAVFPTTSKQILRYLYG